MCEAVPCKEERQIEVAYTPISNASNLEKRLFLTYLKTVLEYDRFYSNENCYKCFRDAIEVFNLDMDYASVSDEFFTDFGKDFWIRRKVFIVEFLTKLNSVKLPCEKSTLEQKVECIVKIFKLDSTAKDLLLFLCMIDSPLIRSFCGVYSLTETTNFYDVFWCLIHRRSSYYENFNLTEKLYSLGFLLSKDATNGKNQLVTRIKDIITDPQPFKRSTFVSQLLGDKEVSQLKLKDFNYVKSDNVITILDNATEQKIKGVNILLYGCVGTGKTEFAKVIAKQSKLNMYSILTETKNGDEAKRQERLADLQFKSKLLEGTKHSCLLFDEAEDVMNRGFTEDGTSSKGYLNRVLENVSVPVIWTTNNIYDVDPAFLRRMTYCIKFDKLNEEQRLNVWNNILKKNKMKLSTNKLNELNQSYDVYPSIISNAIKTVKMINGNEEDFSDIIESVASVVSKKNNVKTDKDSRLEHYDLSLINTNISMSDLTDKIKACNKLNFSLCLYGEPGTGKSLYARYLANELGIEVMFKRASDLISSYVGETEQNIAAAFSEAKSKKAMLIFDEADSFLQNRQTAVRSWEITQVNEMLTQMESYKYPFVCTTNLMDNLDEASLRRFTFKIKYDFMNKEQVQKALKHFFDLDCDIFIKGLTPGDFATVQKRADFLNLKEESDIIKMLQDEVKVKKSKTLQNTIGF